MATILGPEELLLLLEGASLPQNLPQPIVTHSAFSPACPPEASQHGIPGILGAHGDGELNYPRGKPYRSKGTGLADLRKGLYRGAQEE